MNRIDRRGLLALSSVLSLESLMGPQLRAAGTSRPEPTSRDWKKQRSLVLGPFGLDTLYNAREFVKEHSLSRMFKQGESPREQVMADALAKTSVYLIDEAVSDTEGGWTFAIGTFPTATAAGPLVHEFEDKNGIKCVLSLVGLSRVGGLTDFNNKPSTRERGLHFDLQVVRIRADSSWELVGKLGVSLPQGSLVYDAEGRIKKKWGLKIN